MSLIHECWALVVDGRLTALFVCGCGWRGSLTGAIAHAVTNQFRVPA